MSSDEVDQKGLDLVCSMLDVSRETQGRLQAYIRLLRHWQAKMNLVAPSTLDAVWKRHVADSIQVFCLRPAARHWIDIGSGAGFPGLVVAILLADKTLGEGTGIVHLVESVEKKCAFLNAAGRETGIKNEGVALSVHPERIEAILPKLDPPEIVSARALAPLSTLLNMTSIHLTNGAIGLFSKGQGYESEIELALDAWEFDIKTHTSQLEEKSVILEIHNLKKKSSA